MVLRIAQQLPNPFEFSVGDAVRAWQSVGFSRGADVGRKA